MEWWTWFVVSGLGAAVVEGGRRVVKSYTKKGSWEREISEVAICLANAIIDPNWSQADEARLVEELHDVIQKAQETLDGDDDPTAGID